MKNTTFKTCLGFTAGALLLTTNAMAYTQSNSSAIVDWDSFVIDAAGMTLNFNIDNSSGSYRGSKSQAGYMFDWETSWPDMSIGLENATSSATEQIDTAAFVPSTPGSLFPTNGAEAHTTNLEISASSSSTADEGNYFSAASIAQRWGSFYVASGSGTIDLSYNYNLSTDGTSEGYSYGLAQTWATLTTYDSVNGWVTHPTVSDYIDLVLDLNTVSGSESTGTQTLTMSGDFSAGMYGIYYISTKSVSAVADQAAPVPVPQAAWLLGSGLIGLLGLRRRNGQN